MDGKAIHLKSIGKPASLGNDDVSGGLGQGDAMDILPDSTPGKGAEAQPNDDDFSQKPNVLVWQGHFSTTLASFLDPERIQQLKDLYLQGRNPPRVSDSGWAGRKPRPLDEETGLTQSVEQTTTTPEVEQSHKPGGKNSKTVLEGTKTVDDRKVVSEVLVSDYLTADSYVNLALL